MTSLLQQAKHLRPDEREIQLFILSSVFLEQSVKGFDEYIAAKAAAEAFVRCFEKSNSNWQVVTPRLPRPHTDQTSSVKAADQQQTLRVIIDQLRMAFNEIGATATNAQKPDEI